MNYDDYRIDQKSRAVLVSVVCDHFKGHEKEDEVVYSLSELKELLRTLSITTVWQTYQKRKQLEASTILGQGKLDEIAKEARDKDATCLVFDFELTASQMRNIKDITKLDVFDRHTIILEIFAKHAHTKDAKIQIEIARLEYLVPRLPSLWSHFHRQRGGIGVRGGEGEQQIELDRRMIRERIQTYQKELKHIITSRKEQRKRREHQAITAALVGYTNAGKSSLMNRLCKVHVTEENKLFATLDATYRTLNPDSKPPLILIDTVGFISNLPASLVSGFRTTLESATEADLLLVVNDVSNPHYLDQLKVTMDTLQELGLSEKPIFFIFNKKDLAVNPLQAKIAVKKYPHSFLVSSLDEQDMKDLKKNILDYFLDSQPTFDLFIPYEEGEAHSVIKSKTNIIKYKDHELGIFYRVKVPDFIFNSLHLKKYVLSPDEVNRYA